MADVSALIWTTTPWTLPANRALAFHPEFEYVVADTSAGKLLLAKERVNALRGTENRSALDARQLERARNSKASKFQHPFLDLHVPGVLADYVTLDQGSGIVHTAPGHGADDFRTGQKYGLEAYAPQDDEGRFVEGLPEYKGKTVFEANPIVIELLKKRGMLVGEKKITHSYPHCWRCHNPVIFRATEQWFIQHGCRHGRDSRAESTGAAPARAGRNRKSEMASGLGPRPHARNGRGTPGLVHFAPALLGRAADRFLLRRLRQATERFRRAAPRAAVF